MKKVIRHNVFETNSSSTHSLSIKKCNPLDKKVEPDCTFEIRSPLCKVVWLMGLIDNAQEEYNEKVYYHLDEEMEKEIIASIIEDIETDKMELLELLNQKYNNDILNNAEIFELHKYIIELGYPEYANGRDYDYLDDYDTLKFLNNLKSVLIEAYAEIEKIPIQKAKENVMKEAFGCKNPSEDSKVSCCHYFENGVLGECNCGYEDCSWVSCLVAEFDMKETSSKDELIKGAKKFLSNKYKVVGIEDYQRRYRIHTEIIY